MTDYEAVIGLETHIQLNTTTKIFCSCKADSWIDPPNTNICPVCSGLPGVLPVLNKAVVEKGVLLAQAMHSEIRPLSFFDRKNYFYPDLPKGYQISQYDQSAGAAAATWICPYLPQATGYIRRVSITKLHLEEDAGKTKNERGAAPDRFQPLRRAAGRNGHRAGPALRRRSRPVPDPPAPAAALAGHLRSGYGKRPPALRRQCLHPPEGRDLPEPQDRDQKRQLDRSGARRHRKGSRAPDPRSGSRHSASKPGRWNGTRMPACCARCAPRRPRPITAISASRTCCPSAWMMPGSEPSWPICPSCRWSAARASCSQYGLPEYDAEILTSERSLSDYFETGGQGLRRRPQARLQLADERRAAHAQRSAA